MTIEYAKQAACAYRHLTASQSDFNLLAISLYTKSVEVRYRAF